MDEKILDLTNQIEKSRKKRRIWKKIVTSLAAVVVFCTTYMLILPAITMEKETICGKEEHVHGEECYVKITTVQELQLDCTYDSSNVHEHTDECYEVTEEIIKHVHSDSCYNVETEEVSCGYEEGDVETTVASDPVLVCGKEETVPHEHTEECMKTVDAPAADMADLTCGQEESEEHSHTERCYGTWTQTCEIEEHTHDETCLKEESEAPDENQELPEEEEILPDSVDAWAETESETDTGEEEPVNQGSTMKRSANTATYALSRSTALDLTEWIESVTMYKHEGETSTEIQNGTLVTEGDTIRFKIEYVIPGQKLATMSKNEALNVISDTVTYEIPKDFQIVKENHGDIRDSSGNKVGTFTISGHTITLVFNEEYLKENAQGMQIHGHISFYSVVEKVTTSENENQDYEFADGIVLNFNVQENNEVVGDLNVKKRIAQIDGDTITFCIYVASEKGTTGSVTLTDVMSDNLTFVNGSLKVECGGKTIQPQGNLSRLILPELQPGDIYEITYQAKVDGSRIDSELEVSNTATVTGKDSHGNPLDDETTVTHVFDLLEKKGEPGKNAGEIEWTVVVNKEKLDISGWTLTDVVDGEPYVGYARICDQWGNTLEEITLPYTFQAGSNETYIIKYVTTHEVEVDGNTISNNVTLKGPNIEINDSATSGVGSPIEKTGEIIGEAQQGEDDIWSVPIKWTVSISTEQGALPAGTWLNDVMDGYPSEDTYVTYEQLDQILQHFSTVIKDAGGSVDETKTRVTLFVKGDSRGETYYWNELNEKVPNYQSQKFEGFSICLKEGVPKGKTLTFAYEVTGLFADNFVSNVRYANLFDINGRYRVEGGVNYSAGVVEATKYAVTIYDPNTPVDEQLHHFYYGGGNYEINYDDLIDNYLAWGVEISVPPDYKGTGDIILYENLPEGVSIRGMYIHYNSELPSKNQELQKMEPGKTYILSTTVYPDVTQYDIWEPYRKNGVSVEIKVEVTNDGDVKITFPGTMLKIMAEKAKIYPFQPHEKREWWAYFYFLTQINDDFEWTPTAEDALIYKNEFKNEFIVQDINGDEIDTAYQTQEVERNETEGNVIKSASRNNNIITYQVVLNPDALNLNPNSDTLPVTDTLTYTTTQDKHMKMQLVPNSVKLYEYKKTDAEGNPIEVDFAYQYNESSAISSGKIERTHTIDLTIPDSKALVLEYEYMVVGEKGQSYELANTCTIAGAGNGEVSSGSDIDITVVQSDAGADVDGVVIYKVDSSNHGVYLEDAKFALYIWNGDEKDPKYIPWSIDGKYEFITEKNGRLSPNLAGQYLAYNTAYYLIEEEAPDGYYLLNEPYYFYVSHEDTTKYPSCKPEGFNGTELKKGDIIYLKNETSLTEITVRKKWQDYNHDEIKVTEDEVSSVSFELWRKLEGVEGSDEKCGNTYTIIPDANGNWEKTIKGLPKGKDLNEDGKNVGDVPYLYYIKEVSVPGFKLVGCEYDDGNPSTTDTQNGIHSGTITMTNRETDGYELPETGGIGTKPYTMGGLLLTTVATLFLLLYKNKKHGKEDITSS